MEGNTRGDLSLDLFVAKSQVGGLGAIDRFVLMGGSPEKVVIFNSFRGLFRNKWTGSLPLPLLEEQ
jgi:hypothetical protein